MLNMLTICLTTCLLQHPQFLPGFPGLAAHPLPPEHSIGPSEAGAAAAVAAVPEAQEESSSEYDTWRYPKIDGVQWKFL